jgi:Bacterial membrane protein YfhO
VKPAGAERIKGAVSAAVLLAVVAWAFAPYLRGEAIVVERDALSAVLPVKLFVARSLAAGEIPWWNPAPALGKPFFADPLPGVLYPANPLLLVPPFARGYDLFMVVQYLWTALGAFLCLRAAKLPRIAALGGALVWALGGALVSLANVVNHLCAAAWLPWVLYGWSAPSTVPTRIAGAALAMVPAFLAGSPEMAALIALALLVWSVDWRAALVPPLAAGLAAVQIVPILSYLGLTYRGAIAIAESDAMRLSASPAQIVGIVWAGVPVDPTSPASFLASAHVGPIVVGLALLGLVTTPRRRALALAAVAVVVIVVALGSHTPLLPAVYRHVPLFGLVRYPGKALVALHALVAFGAGFGLARICAWAAAGERSPAVRSVAGAAGILVVVMALAPLLLGAGDVVSSEDPASVLTPPPIATAMAADRPGPLRYYANTAGLPPVSTPSAAVDLDRELLLAATGELYGLANVNTPSSLNLVAHEILQKALRSASRDRALSALAALGTRYVTSWPPLETGPMVRAVLSDPGGRGANLYGLEGASERAYLARRVVFASDALGAIGRFVLTSAGHHDGLAVLEGSDRAAHEDPVLAAAIGAAGSTVGTIRWLRDDDSSVALEVTADGPALLVLNDTWVPGWWATIDGEPASIVRVNGLVRGLALAAGIHRVEMDYRPPGLREGVLLSIASALVLALLLAAGRRGAVVARSRGSESR